MNAKEWKKVIENLNAVYQALKQLSKKDRIFFSQNIAEYLNMSIHVVSWEFVVAFKRGGT